jgi:hypothetical protein
MKNIKIILIFIYLLNGLAFAEDGHDHSIQEKYDEHKDSKVHDHETSKAIGKGKAIEIVDEIKGFKLSKESIATLNLKFQKIDGNEFRINKSTLVSSKSIKGVYRFRAGFFKLLSAKILKETDSEYRVKVAGLNLNDQIVISGVGLLRVADIYSIDKSEYGHSH